MSVLYWTNYKKPYLEISCLFNIVDADISFCLPNIRIYTEENQNIILKDLEIVSINEDMTVVIKRPQYQQVQNKTEKKSILCIFVDNYFSLYLFYKKYTPTGFL